MTDNARGEALAKLDRLGIEAIVDRVSGGETQTSICKDLGITYGVLLRWIAADSERSARLRDARIQAAHAYTDEAKDLIDKARTAFELAKAREMGFHLRWQASKANPRDFGDKLQVDQTVNVINLSDEEIDRRAAALEARLIEAAKLPPGLPGGGE